MSECLLSNLTKEKYMKPEVNAVLEEVKASLANPQPTAKPPLTSAQLPDFTTMSIMEATKWCMEHGIDKPQAITNLTGKTSQSVYTALWKLRNPKRVKVLARRAKKAKAKAKEVKIMLIKDATKGKTTKITKPKIENGLYEDGMETPWRDSVMRRGGSFIPPRSLDMAKEWLAEKTETTSQLLAENRRLKILVEHYENLLFKGGK